MTRASLTLEAMSAVEAPLPRLTRAFIVPFFLYQVLYVTGAFSTRHFFLLNESHRAITLGLLIILTFMMRRGGANETRPLPWYDVAIMAAGAFGCFYIAPTTKIIELQMGSPVVSGLELTLGVVTILVLLEGTRRVSGVVLPALLALVIVYAVFADRFPGFLYGRAHPFTRVIGELYLSLTGIFGSVMGLWTSVLVVFILFGAFLQASGAGAFFVTLSLAVAGHLRGGAAKVAVIASGLFGTISGSAAADCATTGVVTIPMMMALGYRPAFAGAVEAVASTGGVLMPPVMGMVAFMVAEFLDIPYLQVCIAATIPALLYYASLYMLVDLEARKSGLRGLPKSELPSLADALKEGWLFFIPVGVLVYYLAVLRYTPGMSAVYSLIALFVVSVLKKETRFTPSRIMAGFEAAARHSVPIAIICGSVGILVAGLAITGATLRMAVLLVEASGQQLLPLLLLAGFASLVLGTGVPAIASYTLLAVSVAPAITTLGVPVIGAHLFVLYWGISHLITPPVGGSLYVAASFSGVDIWRQGYHATMLGLALFVVPFMFCYHPELLMIGSPVRIVIQAALALASMGCVACAFIGYLRGPLPPAARVALALAAVALIVQGPLALGAGVTTIAGVLVTHKGRSA